MYYVRGGELKYNFCKKTGIARIPQKFKIEGFEIIVNGYKRLDFVAKVFILVFCGGPTLAHSLLP